VADHRRLCRSGRIRVRNTKLTDMITNQTNRPSLRLLVVLARHDAILPNLDGVHQTRDGAGCRSLPELLTFLRR